MSKIRVLDEVTANQIAAGEVVERPASVVKELVENALDAGATRITVEINDGGKSLIRITDNGCGMSPEDARLSLERHATSKIRTAEDLNHIATLGFRGEAVPSIASVSKFEIVTREPESVAGHRILVEGGRISEQGEIGCPVGTRITVQDLFYNTPARLKYLKTNATEMSQIGDILTRHAMSHPHVSFRLVTGSTQVFVTPGSGRVEDAALGLLGRDVIKSLLPVDLTDMSVRITGYVGAPSLARSGRSHQFFFVNGRPIKQLNGRYALEEAYAHLVPNGKYPICVLFLQVPPDEVDVNVHPAKAEVRFVKEREVRSALFRAAREALGRALLVPGVEGQHVADVAATTEGATLLDRPADPAAGDSRPGPAAGSGDGGGPWAGPVVPNRPTFGNPASARPADYDQRMNRVFGPGSDEPSTGARPAGGYGGGASSYGGTTPADVNARQGWVPPGARRPGQGGGLATPPPWQPSGEAAAWPGSRESVPDYVPSGASADTDAAPGTAAGAPAAQTAAEAAGTYAAYAAQPPVQGTFLERPGSDQAALIRSLRPLGQIHRSYIACDGPGGLYVIDQHAAHERIFFERLLDSAIHGDEAVQPLLFPLTLELTLPQLLIWQAHAEIFQESGFRAEPFGGNTLLVHGIPASLGSANPATLVMDFLERVTEEKLQPGSSPLERRKRIAAALAACKAAIKARDALQPEDLDALLTDLAACQSPTTCPHGRPTVIALPIADLEKRFGRT